MSNHKTRHNGGKVSAPFQSKRGISPLVATVLLLAFAVAVGTMVVSILSESIKTKPCDNVGVGVEGSVCLLQDSVTFIATNTGKKPIANLKVRLVNENTKDVTEPQVANELAVGSAGKVSFSYQTINPDAISVTVVPVVQGKDGPEYCQEHAISKLKLVAC